MECPGCHISYCLDCHEPVEPHVYRCETCLIDSDARDPYVIDAREARAEVRTANQSMGKMYEGWISTANKFHEKMNNLISELRFYRNLSATWRLVHTYRVEVDQINSPAINPNEAYLTAETMHSLAVKKAIELEKGSEHTMPRHIIKIPHEGTDYYLLWSTVVDAPVSMSRSPMELLSYGHRPEKSSIDRVEKYGTSCLEPTSVLELIAGNRAGLGETELSLGEIIKRYIAFDG